MPPKPMLQDVVMCLRVLVANCDIIQVHVAKTTRMRAHTHKPCMAEAKKACLWCYWWYSTADFVLRTSSSLYGLINGPDWASSANCNWQKREQWWLNAREKIDIWGEKGRFKDAGMYIPLDRWNSSRHNSSAVKATIPGGYLLRTEGTKKNLSKCQQPKCATPSDVKWNSFLSYRCILNVLLWASLLILSIIVTRVVVSLQHKLSLQKVL